MNERIATSYTPKEWTAILSEWRFPPFRANQISDWLFNHCVATFDDMKNLPADLRNRLAQEFVLSPYRSTESYLSSDGETTRYLSETLDGARIESVSIRTDKRHTVCLSSQVGCPVGCAFCASGLDGFVRNLTAAEILEPVRIATRTTGRRVTNVVVMGTGEPMLNLDAVLAALERLNDERGLNIGARKMTVSTAGIPDGIRRFARTDAQYGLAVSLHSADDELRNQLVPINRKHPIAEVLDAVRFYIEKTNRQVTFEYVLLAGVNDGMPDARRLAERLKDIPMAKVNLIPFNPSPDLPYQRPSNNRIHSFSEELTEASLINTIRQSSGGDVHAACGQLRRR
ncbi:MAG: 23S rRNA (adenine(2503)-C(2))-methyltransferase RlmN [Planctomycetota bacterium]